jgi:hypothetical protein
MALQWPLVAASAAGVVCSLPAIAAMKTIAAAGRAEFRKLVDDYQIFTVPHCAPSTVAAYNDARAARDAAFVTSLKRTPLFSDYRKAVADRARKDRKTFYECVQPPPPPGFTADDAVREQREDRDRHFVEGDKQFAKMIALRDKLLAASGD